MYGKDYDLYQIKFWANELAEVIVVGDGDNDLDLYIYDGNGNLIASDTSRGGVGVPLGDCLTFPFLLYHQIMVAILQVYSRRVKFISVHFQGR